MYQHLPSPVKFREDINGLRAWAVIAVLLFHFSLIGLPGGFAGVDIFFVISGYLMTAIIVGGYEKGNFSIWKFYMARARRILPALLAVIAVLLVLGWFWLPTPDYKSLGAQSAYGMSFLSNMYYLRSAGYFDSAAEEKWLLHTWSLAVEAQFYLLYPIFIALIWKFWKSLKVVTIAVLILFLASLALNLVVSNWKPTAAFYLLPTRGWELAAGALVFLIAKQYKLPKKPLSFLFWAGWLMVIGSFFFIDETFVWPSYWAVLPVLGTSLIILAYKEDCFLTNNAVAQWLGDRSYSLYLWHWPLVVALYFASLQNDWTWVISFFALSIILAHFSYQLIETPTRKYLSEAKLFKEVLVIVISGIVVGLFAVSSRLFIFEDRIDKEIERAAGIDVEKKINTNHRLFMKGCGYNFESNTIPICSFDKNLRVYKSFGDSILIGDSHSASVLSAVSKASKNKRVVYLGGLSGCPFQNKEMKSYSGDCLQGNKVIQEVIKEYEDIPLIIVNAMHDERFDSYSDFEKTMVDTTCSYSEDRKVYLMRPIPYMKVNVPKYMARNLIFGRSAEEVSISLEEYNKRAKTIWKAQDVTAQKCGAVILNPLPYLCDDQNCYGSLNGQPLYIDTNHLNEFGNKLLIPMFEEVFKSNKKSLAVDRDS